MDSSRGRNDMIALANVVKDIFVLVGMSYLYFWKGVSGWWWVLAILILASEYKAEKVES